MTRMPVRHEPDTNELLDQASRGDTASRQQLLVRHRKRLRHMITLRMDRRLVARVDPSDVVQEALTEAAQRLSDYLQRRPLPFYPWLRQLAWERLLELHRKHLYAKRRTVTREEPGVLDLPEDSAVQLASRLIAPGSSPSGRLLQEEMHARIQAALAALSTRDREVLVLRHLEQLSTRDAAAVLGMTEAGVKSRHVRALKRLRCLLVDAGLGDES
jgi:RNA polymerase sigma-70 factor (ECF subfamily)